VSILQRPAFLLLEAAVRLELKTPTGFRWRDLGKRPARVISAGCCEAKIP